MLEVYDSDKRWQLVLNLSRSQSLQDYMGKSSLSLRACVQILKAVTLALQHMLFSGLVHGDVHPLHIYLLGPPSSENSLSSQEVVLTNLHRALPSGSPALAHLPPQLGYQAPEVMIPLPLYHPSSDIFSLGMVLHRMLLGNTPFDSAKEIDTFNNNRQCDIPFHQEEYGLLDKDVLDLLKGMLAKKPEERLRIEDILNWLYT